ncbi:hypothetical protein GCM10017788_40690 [Amycolatopsis acidiphila]|nr:hypothetical protein GCM10017788_40690 [Amycolatopsis acidiphila]
MCVGRHDSHVAVLAEAIAQLADEGGITFDGEDLRSCFSQMGGDSALAGAELDDEIVAIECAGPDELDGDSGHGKEMHDAGAPGTGCRGHEDSTS